MKVFCVWNELGGLFELKVVFVESLFRMMYLNMLEVILLKKRYGLVFVSGWM